MLGKIVNGALVSAPYKVTDGGYHYYNPPDAVLLRMGYKPVAEDPMPEGEGMYEPHYEDLGEVIVKRWELVEVGEVYADS